MTPLAEKMMPVSETGMRDVPGALLFDAAGHACMMAHVRRMLEGLHMRAHVAGTVEQAVRLCRESRPRLIVVPAGHEGGRLLWQLQHAGLAGAEGDRPAVLALLPRADAHMILWMLVQGADECLTWPFDAQLLATTLRRLPAWSGREMETALQKTA